MTSPETFRDLIATVTGTIHGHLLDHALEAELNARFPATGPTFRDVVGACRDGIAAG
jgi:hypothetical protein